MADIHSKRLANASQRQASAATIASIEAQITNLPATLITHETTAASALHPAIVEREEVHLRHPTTRHQEVGALMGVLMAPSAPKSAS